MMIVVENVGYGEVHALFLFREQLMIEQLLPILQTCLAVGNLCIMLWALKTFLNKPHNTLDARITAIEVDVREIKQSLLQGNDRFREQNDTNEVMQTCMLALIDFELGYCIHTNYGDTDDLIKAKDALRKHLARK